MEKLGSEFGFFFSSSGIGGVIAEFQGSQAAKADSSIGCTREFRAPGTDTFIASFIWLENQGEARDAFLILDGGAEGALQCRDKTVDETRLGPGRSHTLGVEKMVAQTTQRFGGMSSFREFCRDWASSEHVITFEAQGQKAADQHTCGW